jgi:hypothetical protein
MEDILYYLLIGLGYVLYSWLTRKKQPQVVPEREPEGRQDTESPRQVTFEELLREITQSRQEQQTGVPQEEAVWDYEIDADKRDIKEETFTTPEYREDSAIRQVRPQYYEEYLQGKEIAFQRPSLEETMQLKDVKVDYSRFAPFEKAEPVNLLEVYTSDLFTAEGLKKAFVLSEVINRRYF